jgi:hypothetical protein
MTMPDQIDPGKLEKVFQALENPKYEWRTIGGVVAETGFPTEEVVEIISMNRDSIIQAPFQSREGHDLFTTKEHFMQKASFIQKIAGSFKNRAL